MTERASGCKIANVQLCGLAYPEGTPEKFAG